MKLIDKMRFEHPELCSDVWNSGTLNCPHQHKYKDPPDYCILRHNKNFNSIVDCKMCWDREIEGEIKKDDKDMCDKYPYVDEHDYNCARVLEQQRDSFIESVQKATAQAIADGIKANSILINKNMVRVPEFGMQLSNGHGVMMPRMICGLNVYLTKDELPEGCAFAVLECPENNRLAQFEAIGMESDELRKAADFYRQVKEVFG